MAEESGWRRRFGEKGGLKRRRWGRDFLEAWEVG